MSHAPTAKDVRMLTSIRARLVDAMQRNGVPVPARYLDTGIPFEPVACRHAVSWTTCGQCSKQKAKP